MTKGHVLREALNRLYLIRSSKSDTSEKTKEEDWLESITRLHSYNVFNALLDKVEEINGEANI